MKQGKKTITETSFRELVDGSLLEMVYNPKESLQTCFIRFIPGDVSTEGEYKTIPSYFDGKRELVPLKLTKIIETETVRFPSGLCKYNSEAELVGEIEAFIRKFVSVSDFFTMISVYYVLFTWIYDRFSVVPYLRVLGGPGSGKSRYLQVVGSLCYKPLFTMGAATMSPIFRLQDKLHGTLILDESDFNRSDEAHLVIKMLNTGYQKGFPLLRSEGKNFEPTPFDVFGPKIIATTKMFPDKALESRCITEKMEGKLRGDVPIMLPESFKSEANLLRNKLLWFRLSNYHHIQISGEFERTILELDAQPRLKQIILPLASVIKDKSFIEELRGAMLQRDSDIALDQLDTTTGRIVQTIVRAYDRSVRDVSIEQIATALNIEISNERYRISPERVGKVIRELGLPKKRKSEGTYVVLDTPEATEVIEHLKKQYKLTSNGNSSAN